MVLAARREDRLEEVAADVEGETLVVPTDVTDGAAVDSLIEEALDSFDGIDIVVNNAAVLLGDPVAEADRADLREQVEVNLQGTMTTTHAALPALLEGDGGHVMAVSSMNARSPVAGGSAYSASKAGVNAFCDSLRQELADEQVRVTVVMPGPVQTEMRDWSDWDGRALEPEDVAETITFAVSRPDHVELRDLTVNTTDKLG